MRAIRVVLLACLLSPLSAQTPASGSPNPTQQARPAVAPKAPQTTSKRYSPKRRRNQVTTTAVHRAWLNEVVDLDRERAVQAYDKILKNTGRDSPERWLAVSRLRELVRIGVGNLEPVPAPKDVPPDVKTALDLLETPFPFEALLQDTDNKIELPPIRPASHGVQTWVRGQIGLTVRERWGATVRRRTNRTANPSTAPYEDRIAQINDIVRREIAGNRLQADALRALYFAGWTPPKVKGPREKVLAEAMQRLAAMIASEASQRQSTLQYLETGILALIKSADTPAEGATTAVELIRRLPLYSKKLLGPKPAKETQSKATPK